MNSRQESDPARLAASLRQLDDALTGCMKCGLCQAVCPVFGVTRREADVARGKLALLDGLARHLLEGDAAARQVEDRLNRCLLCGSCEAQCPSGVPLTDIFIQARVLLTGYRACRRSKRPCSGGCWPGLFDALARLGRHGQKLVFRPAGAAGQTVSAPRLVTYHDSCHLKKGLGVTAEPRALIAANPAYRLVEMARADACCGHGGSFNLFRYELSARIGQAKRDAVVASGADTVAAGCPACMLQLMDMLAKNGDTIRVRHSLKIYAEALPDVPTPANDPGAATHR